MPIQEYKKFLGQQNKVSNFGGDPRYLEVLDNCNVNQRSGEITKDVGYSRLGTAAVETGQSITGLFDFHQSPTIQRAFATVNNEAGTNLTLWYVDAPYGAANVWTNISAGASWDAFEDCAVEMESFLGYCYFVGYDSTDNVFLPNTTVTNTTFSTVDGTTDMAQGRYIKRYRDRLYVGNTRSAGVNFPYRVYFSNAGARTWDLTNNFVDFDYGSQITGMGTIGDFLAVFTPYEGWIYNQSVRKATIKEGCVNHRTIQNYKDMLLFANHEGVWSTQGGKATLISQDVREFIKASTNPLGWRAGINGAEYWLSIGNVTVNYDNEDLSFVNTQLVYNILENSWHVRELAQVPNVFMKVWDRTTGIETLNFGATNGTVFIVSRPEQTSPSLSYGGSDISAFFLTRPLDLGSEVDRKVVTKLYAYAGRGQGLKLRGRWIDKNRRSNWFDIGLVNSQYDELDIPPDNRSGVFLQIEGSERSQLTPFTFKGFNLSVDLDSNQR